MNSNPNLLVVEDDVLYALEAKMILEDGFSSSNITVCHSAASAKKHLAKGKLPDVVLLDIVLEHDTASLEVGQYLKKSGVPIICMTAYEHNEQLQMAMRIDPLHFLHKPMSATQLVGTVKFALQEANTRKANQDTLFFKRKKVIESVSITDIYAIEAYGNYCIFRTKEMKYTKRMALKNYQEIVTSSSFIRVHRNFVINLNFLESIDKESNEVVVNGVRLPVSQRFRVELLKKLPCG